MTALFFGLWYDAPAYDDATEFPAPVGQACYQCAEPVADGDDGWVRPVEWDLNTPATAEPVHRECDLLGIVGHLGGCALARSHLTGTGRRG